MRRPLLLAILLALFTSLLIGPAASANEERALGGTVVFGHDQEPTTLNAYTTEGNSYTTSLAVNPILAAGLIYNQKAKLVPLLFEGQPKLLKSDPLTVTFKYKASAKWSDGRQITGADFVATYRTQMNPNWDITTREGWEDIASVKAKGKSVTVTWKKGKPYAAWDALIGNTATMPAHKVAGQNFNELWRSSMDIASGPFRFASWQRGTQLVLARNNSFAAGPKAKLDRVIFRYIPSTPSLFQALQSGEIDAIEPQPQLQIADMRKASSLKVQGIPSYSWEHVDIQTGPKGHPALAKKYVRQALMMGINRAQIRAALYISPGLVTAKELPILQSHLYKPFESDYTPVWARWGFSQKKVVALLRKNGCTGGPSTPSASNNSIYSCPDVGKLSFRFTTTSGNQLRSLSFEIMQRQLRSVGIELLPRFGPAGTVFGQVLPSSDWDLFLFGWVGSPSSTATSFSLYGCGGDLNYMNYCNRKSSGLFKQAQFTTDPKKRADLLRKAEVIMADDVPSIPLFIKPRFLINNRKVSGTIANPTNQGSTWNAQSWTVTAR